MTIQERATELIAKVIEEARADYHTDHYAAVLAVRALAEAGLLIMDPLPDEDGGILNVADTAMIRVYNSEDDEEEYPWTITGDLRLTDDDEANYVADGVFRAKFPNITFDPEFSQFFAYAATEDEANEFVKALGEWVATR